VAVSGTRLLKAPAALAGVAVATVAMDTAHANHTVAALLYVVVVVGASFLGPLPATVAVLAAFGAQNYFFTPPRGSLRINGAEAVVALLVFGVTAAVVSAAVTRVNELRRRAHVRELEARARLELTEQLHREASRARVDAASQQSRAAFLSAMTHNLRTPLASIRASVSTLLAHPDLEPTTRDELLATARSQTERLERLVTKVLHLSRIRSGAVDVQREPVDLAELVRSALRSVRALTAERTIRMVDTVGTTDVALDPTLVEIALACLIENALRYAPNDDEIAVMIAVVDGEAVIRVVDHGPGIPSAEREHVFDEFVRGEGVHDATGAGIGLTIARAFVDGHGGRLRVEDTPGGGATLVMNLPCEGPIGEEER
jgi:two-component system sensor histidine kinase KdpD